MDTSRDLSIKERFFSPVSFIVPWHLPLIAMVLLAMENFFSIPIKIYKIVGLTPFPDPTSIKYANYRRYIFWFSLVNLTIDVQAEASYFIHGLTQSGNFLKMISCVACTVFGAMGWEELLMIRRKREKIARLINFLGAEFPKSAEDQEKFQIERLYKETRAFMTSFATLFIVLISAFNFSPVIVNILDVYFGGEWNTDFPFYMWFPFDPTSSVPLYVVMYILESWGGFTAVMSCLAMNLLLGAIVTQICLQLEMLKRNLQEAVLEEGKGRSHSLRPIVLKHCQIVQGCQDLEEIFTVSIFFNYMSSSLIICLVLFQVVVGSDLAEIIKFCLFLLSSLLQTWTMSHFGQEMIDHSIGIASAVYKSNWLETDAETRKVLLLMLRRCQTPLKISAYKMTTVSFPSFFKIMSSSYSYFALLRTMYSKGV